MLMQDEIKERCGGCSGRKLARECKISYGGACKAITYCNHGLVSMEIKQIIAL